MSVPEIDHFEFSDHEAAFAAFYAAKADDDSLVFVVEESFYLSGYWIEVADPSLPLRETTHIYRTVDEVKLLEQRVRAAINKSKPSHAVGYVVV